MYRSDLCDMAWLVGLYSRNYVFIRIYPCRTSNTSRCLHSNAIVHRDFQEHEQIHQSEMIPLNYQVILKLKA